MRVPSYRRHSSGNARVTIQGKDYILGEFDSPESRTAYQQLIAEFLANGFIKSQDADDRTLMADVLRMFRQHAETYASKSDLGEFKAVADAVVVLADYGGLAACEFGVAQFRAVRLKMAEQGWLRQTVNRRMQRLLQMLRWAVTEDLFNLERYQKLMLVDPLKKGRCDCPESVPVEPVREREIKAVLPRVSPVVQDMINLQRLTGARPAEVCKLTPRMIDRSETVWTSKLGEHKTAHHNKKRMLAFGPHAQKILTKYLFREPDECLFSPTESCEQYRQKKESERQTPKGYGNARGSNRVKNAKRSPGTMFTTSSYRRAIHRACEAAGIEKWSPNQIRHLRATEVSKEFGIEAAQIMLGHSSIKTTEIYAERDLAKLTAIMEKIG